MAWFVVAAVMQAVVAFPYLMSGLLVPPYAVAILWAVWIAATVALVRFRSRGPVLLLIPIATAALWFGLISLGEALFGWTA